ncbi:MAG: site-specific integrase, partial [Thermoplasmata archaeon]
MVKPYKDSLEDEFKRLEMEDYSEEVKKSIKKFVNDLRIKEGVSEVRLMGYVQRLRKIAEIIPDGFLNPKEEDIEKVLEHLYSENYKDWTRYTFITMLKKYYRWKLKTLPEYIAKLNIKIKDNGKMPDDLLTKEDVNKLIENSKNARDRALFAVLYDSGC